MTKTFLRLSFTSFLVFSINLSYSCSEFFLGAPAKIDNLQINIKGYSDHKEFREQMTVIAEEVSDIILNDKKATFKKIFMHVAQKRSKIQFGRWNRGGKWHLWKTLRTKKTSSWYTPSLGYEFAIKPALKNLGQRYGYLPNGKKILLTTIQKIVEKDGKITIWWEHTPHKSITPIMNHVGSLYKKIQKENLSTEELVRVVAEMHWWISHAVPLQRGTASVMDAITKGIFYSKGIVPGKWKTNTSPDFEAYHNDLDVFINRYIYFFSG